MDRYLILSFLALISFHYAYCEGKRWALLVAGSKTWENYRHQADICHAYQLLRAEGVPEENIITMMFDDVANHTRNPHKGVLINIPNGPNVYEGVKKDYTGKDLNVRNLLNVLTGNKEAMKGIGSGRVIESDHKDTIFVNIVDHGSTGTISINDEYLYADELNKALKLMKSARKYAKIVMYIEACESGSMFDSIIDDEASVYVMTAAAPGENSFVRYFSDELDTYIGDAFSTIWMENMDKIQKEWNPAFTTLFKQYKYVRSNVNQSHVNLYGDFRLGFDKVSRYMGDAHKMNRRRSQILTQAIKSNHVNIKGHEEYVSLADVQTELINKKIKKANNLIAKAALKKQLIKIEEDRSIIDSIMDTIVKEISEDDPQLGFNLMFSKSIPKLETFPCYRNFINIFNKNCLNTHEHRYATKHFFKFLNMCESKIEAEDFSNVLTNVCKDLNTKINRQL